MTIEQSWHGGSGDPLGGKVGTGGGEELSLRTARAIVTVWKKAKSVLGVEKDAKPGNGNPNTTSKQW